MKNVVVIGGGVAGMEAASYLAAKGYGVDLVEKEHAPGGRVARWDRLFPTMRRGSEVIDFLALGMSNGQIKKYFGCTITQISRNGNGFVLQCSNGVPLVCDAILLATGYDLFDARKKEEYGYGIYNNVMTSADLEACFVSGEPLRTASGKVPTRIGMVHCVGSRDEKAGHTYCSKVCCVTGVKQAIEIKEQLPDAEVFNFYMDLRMYGMHFEALYKKAQEEFNVQFVRGRLSEAGENLDGSIALKVEDTLAGRPMKMNVDLLVLLVGCVPSAGTEMMAEMLGLKLGVNGFFRTVDQHTMTNYSAVPGVFFAGTCIGPNTITNSITDARAAATAIDIYLSENELANRKMKSDEEFWLYPAQ